MIAVAAGVCIGLAACLGFLGWALAVTARAAQCWEGDGREDSDHCPCVQCEGTINEEDERRLQASLEWRQRAKEYQG